MYSEQVLNNLNQKYQHQPEFLQAVKEVFSTLTPLLQRYNIYEKYRILERIVEPERTISFRIEWIDDRGEIQVNRGWRVQYNSALGPYKGGIRLHPTVNEGILKFLGFEQIFKNSLTGTAIGGAKGGSDFDPKGRSDAEIMRFCQAFMIQLYRYIGPTIDVPAGDIGVGAREIGYLYGAYKRLTTRYEGVLTGKGLNYGGSLARKEATGYGLVYFTEKVLADRGEGLEGKRCAVSGSGNVATYCVEKLLQLGAIPVTVSDSRGAIYDPNGINLEVLKQVKEVERLSLEHYAAQVQSATYVPVSQYPQNMHYVWSVPVDIALPCATQNELTMDDAKALITNGCTCIAEGANMPSTIDAINLIRESGIAYAPAKAANAGGVATSQLEMEQNAAMTSWSFDDVDRKLKEIMSNIYVATSETAVEFGSPSDLMLGSNIAGFRKVADTMIAQGVM